MSGLIQVLALTHALAAHPAPAAYSRVCLDAAEARQAVVDHKLASPIVAQRTAATVHPGEFLRSRLCRWNEDYVYEITLLPRDGHVTQVYIRAADGRVVGKNGE